MSITPPGRTDYDVRIVELARDFRNGEARAVDIMTRWATIGTQGQTDLGYAPEDIATVNVFLAFLVQVKALMDAISVDETHTNNQVLESLAPFTQNR